MTMNQSKDSKGGAVTLQMLQQARNDRIINASLSIMYIINL